MKKTELFKHFRFFKGEDECPDSLQDISIFATGYWFDEALAYEVCESEEEASYIESWKRAGAPGADTKLPEVLLSVMFAGYCKGSDMELDICAKNFSSVFLPRYIASTSI